MYFLGVYADNWTVLGVQVLNDEDILAMANDVMVELVAEWG